MKTLKILFTAAALSLGLAGCGGGGGSGGGTPDKELATTAPAEVTILPGASQKYAISGGVPPYRASTSETQIAIGAVNGNELLIGAVNPGTATVRVLDYANADLAIEVTVGTSVPLTSTAPSNLVMGVGDNHHARTFTIRGGVPPYVVEGSENNAFKVEKLGNDEFKVIGVAIGGGNITITDKANTVLDIAVTVGSPELRVSPTELKLFPGIDAEITISGGQPPYRPAGGIPDAIDVICKPGYEVNCEQMIIKPKLASKLEFAIADATGKLAEVEVEVEIGQAAFGISPSFLMIQDNITTPIMLNIYGAAEGEVCFFTVPADVINTPRCTTERSIQITASTAETLCKGDIQTVTLTAVDSKGFIGTATIGVQGSGDCGPDQQP